MNYFNQFFIPFTGLKEGEHRFNFEIGDEFFEKYNYSDLRKGDLRVELILDKQERMLTLTFNISGTVEVMCDRCLDNYNQLVQGKEKLFIKFGRDFHEETEEILIIPESEHQINVGHYIYEYINLLIPYRRVHPDDNNGESMCNKDVISKLQEYVRHDVVDPRWETLNHLRNKLKKN
jgi:uncharacterized metal-binding protein YceD (DUF177 family)